MAADPTAAAVATEPDAAVAASDPTPAAVDAKTDAVEATPTESAESGRKRRVRKKRDWDKPPSPAANPPPAEGDGEGGDALPSQAAKLPTLTPEQAEKLAAIRRHMQAQTLQFREAQAKRMALNFQQMQPMAPVTLTAPMSAVSTEKAALHRSLLLLGRVYVGNITFDVTEADVREVFQPFGRILKCDLNWDADRNKSKGFCFVEYDAPESAIMAIEAMQGQGIKGRAIKCGRPNNAPSALPYMEPLRAQAKANNRIFVANINPSLGQDDIKGVFEVFGEISMMVMPTMGGSQEAVQSMNHFDLGGQYLRVCFGMSPPQDVIEAVGQVQATPLAAAAAAAAAAPVAPGAVPQAVGPQAGPQALAGLADPAAGRKTTLHQDDNVTISGSSQRMLLMQKLARNMNGPDAKKDSTVVLLKNMVTPEEVDETLEEDVKEECGKHGAVEKVHVYLAHPPGRNTVGPGTFVKVFVKFADAASAKRAIDQLNGRWFACKVISAEVYDEEKFLAGDYSA